MEDIGVLLSMIATAVPLIGGIIACLVRLLKAIKFGKQERTKHLWVQFVQEAVQYVELIKGKSHGELSGDVKKELALNKVENACVKNNINFESDKVSALIENIIGLTKSVNYRTVNDSTDKHTAGTVVNDKLYPKDKNLNLGHDDHTVHGSTVQRPVGSSEVLGSTIIKYTD